MKWRNCRLSTESPNYQLGWAVLALCRQLDILKHNFHFTWWKFLQPRLPGYIVEMACLQPLAPEIEILAGNVGQPNTLIPLIWIINCCTWHILLAIFFYYFFKTYLIIGPFFLFVYTFKSDKVNYLYCITTNKTNKHCS